VRTAEQPGQTLNVDLCFVPEQHAPQAKLPAVSGSSGHLVVERLAGEGEAPHWPGQVFAQPGLGYEAAMLQYVEATQDRRIHPQTERAVDPQAPSVWRQAAEARAERYRVRAQRKREDAAWKAAKAEHRQAVLAQQALARLERPSQQAGWAAQQLAWQQVRAQRRQTVGHRQEEDEAWHQRNRELRAGLSGETAPQAWLAILVVTDNCTRQCLGLPLFRSGAKVTSQEVVAALRAVLPAHLAFLISDQGTHFRSIAFAQLAQQAGFLHVPVYRHRPETNGIAERFVLTLKAWLRSQAWQSVEQLHRLLALFLPEYNHRPHQGLAIPGLSPNEFAKRIGLM
jgi:transposase InsO family protein